MFDYKSKYDMKAKIISILIVLFWMGMMFTLVKDRLYRTFFLPKSSDLTPSALAAKWKDQEEWMRIVYKGIPVGAMATEIKKISQYEGYVLYSRLMFQIRFLTFTNSVLMTASAEMDEEFALTKFLVNFNMAKTSWKIRGRMDRNRLLYRVERDGSVQAGTIPLEKSSSLLDAVQSMAAKNIPLKVGHTYQIPVYDPIWNTGGGIARVYVAKKETITLGDKKFQTFRIETTLNNITTSSWVDADGRTLMRQIMPGLIMHIASREEILGQYPEFKEPVPLPGEMPLRDFSLQPAPPSSDQGGLQDIFKQMIPEEKKKDKQ
jgi:hypothetical protein